MVLSDWSEGGPIMFVGDGMWDALCKLLELSDDELTRKGVRRYSQVELPRIKPVGSPEPHPPVPRTESPGPRAQD